MNTQSSSMITSTVHTVYKENRFGNVNIDTSALHGFPLVKGRAAHRGAQSAKIIQKNTNFCQYKKTRNFSVNCVSFIILNFCGFVKLFFRINRSSKPVRQYRKCYYGRFGLVSRCAGSDSPVNVSKNSTKSAFSCSLSASGSSVLSR